MALMDFIKKQFIDILQWTEEGDGTLAWRFPMAGMEIQNGGTLVVRESQMALFVNEGKIADQFGPGLYTLEPQTNITIASTSSVGRASIGPRWISAARSSSP